MTCVRGAGVRAALEGRNEEVVGGGDGGVWSSMSHLFICPVMKKKEELLFS